jgi:nucleotide-binding universal stress UspA family protein
VSATRKILCAVDLSEPSRLAMIEAAELAKRFQAELALVHVATEPSSATGEVIAAPPELFEQARREAEAVLEGWRLEAEQLSGGTVEAKVLSNRRPAQGIVRFAAEGGFDLVVVATHGRTGLKHLMLGSVAERVVREAPCKVLVVRRS